MAVAGVILMKRPDPAGRDRRRSAINNIFTAQFLSTPMNIFSLGERMTLVNCRKRRGFPTKNLGLLRTPGDHRHRKCSVRDPVRIDFPDGISVMVKSHCGEARVMNRSGIGEQKICVSDGCQRIRTGLGLLNGVIRVPGDEAAARTRPKSSPQEDPSIHHDRRP